MVNEMFIESRNDEGTDKYYHRIAGQAEFDAFWVLGFGFDIL